VNDVQRLLDAGNRCRAAVGGGDAVVVERLMKAAPISLFGVGESRRR
jgi:hypothetical protein